MPLFHRETKLEIPPATLVKEIQTYYSRFNVLIRSTPNEFFSLLEAKRLYGNRGCHLLTLMSHPFFKRSLCCFASLFK